MISQFPLIVAALACIALPSSVDAALFPKKSNVKHLDLNGFRNALKEEVCIPALLKLKLY